MATGFIEFLTALLALGGFGVDANPRAPSAAEVLRYAPADADVMVHVDLAALVPKNYAALAALPTQPGFADTELGPKLAGALQKAEMGRGMVKGMTGLDLVDDVRSATVWLRIPQEGEPEMLGVVRGDIPRDFVDKLAGVAPSKKVEGVTAVEPEPGLLVARTPRGDLIAGSAELVTARLAKGYRPAKGRLAGAETRQLLRGKPFFAAVVAPSEAARGRMVRGMELDPREPVSQLLLDATTGYELFGLYLAHDGLGWTVGAGDPAGAGRAAEASRGVVDLLRAMQYGTRGYAALIFAALPSFGEVPEVAAVLEREKEVRAFVDAWGGDGDFRASVRARGKVVTATARGKELVDVLPASLVLAGAGAGFFLAARDDAPVPTEAVSAAPVEAVPPPVAPAALDLAATFQRVLADHGAAHLAP